MEFGVENSVVHCNTRSIYGFCWICIDRLVVQSSKSLMQVWYWNWWMTFVTIKCMDWKKNEWIFHASSNYSYIYTGYRSNIKMFRLSNVTMGCAVVCCFFEEFCMASPIKKHQSIEHSVGIISRNIFQIWRVISVCYCNLPLFIYDNMDLINTLALHSFKQE